MKFNSVHQFIISQVFIVILLSVNVVELSIIKRDINLTSDVQIEANHLRSFARIVNGSAAIIGQFSHLVSLRNTVTERHFCGGNIIDETWILTAAHCMFLQSGAQLQPWLITIVAGDIWLNRTSSTSQRRTVARVIIHENYDSLTLENDITLLKLNSPLVFRDLAVNYKQLQTTAVSPGTICQVAGWGYPAANIPLVTNELMYVDVPIVSQALCAELYAEDSDIPDGMICAGYIEGMRDACQGDSGGGLICNGILTGIVSWGEGCARPNYPGVYTDVRFYRNWISAQVSNGVESIKFTTFTKLFCFLYMAFIMVS